MHIEKYDHGSIMLSGCFFKTTSKEVGVNGKSELNTGQQRQKTNLASLKRYAAL